MVPYRLTKTQHVLVRAKINGKGPFNFIVDTGARPCSSAEGGQEASASKPDKKGWSDFRPLRDRGRRRDRKGQGPGRDLFQLEGMNGLGLAGVELHGVIGYNVLARYRIEYDFTRHKLAWTKLDFEPPPDRLGRRTAAPAGWK